MRRAPEKLSSEHRRENENRTADPIGTHKPLPHNPPRPTHIAPAQRLRTDSNQPLHPLEVAVVHEPYDYRRTPTPGCTMSSNIQSGRGAWPYDTAATC